MPTLMRKINILSRAEGVYRTDNLTTNDLNACHHSYILAISNNPGMTQDELAKHLCVNKSGVTRHLSHLESYGYVTRVPSEKDRRSMLVYPTDKMLNILPQVKAIIHDWDSLISNSLTVKETKLLHGLLDKITQEAEKYMSNREENCR